MVLAEELGREKNHDIPSNDLKEEEKGQGESSHSELSHVDAGTCWGSASGPKAASQGTDARQSRADRAALNGKAGAVPHE